MIQTLREQGYRAKAIMAVYVIFISERELMFMFAICRRPSVCLSVSLSSVCLSSVTFVHPTQPIEIFGSVSAPCNTLVT